MAKKETRKHIRNAAARAQAASGSGNGASHVSGSDRNGSSSSTSSSASHSTTVAESASSSTIEEEEAVPPIKVLSWNIWLKYGEYRERWPKILEVIREHNPDILCLQEVWEHKERKQARRLARELGFNYYYIGKEDCSGVTCGNAILSRWALRDRSFIELPFVEDYNEHCVALYASVQHPTGVSIPVCVTHLNWRFDHGPVRESQVRAVIEFIEKKTANMRFPVVLAGDFNAEPDSKEIRMLVNKSTGFVPFVDTWAAVSKQPGYTWDNANPNAAQCEEPYRRIDYIFVRRNKASRSGDVLSTQVVGNEAIDGVWPSDHSAVLTELRLA